MLFALTLIAVGFALGGLETGGQDTDIANKVVNLSLPDRRAIQAPALEGVDLGVSTNKPRHDTRNRNLGNRHRPFGGITGWYFPQAGLQCKYPAWHYEPQQGNQAA